MEIKLNQPPLKQNKTSHKAKVIKNSWLEQDKVGKTNRKLRVWGMGLMSSQPARAAIWDPVSTTYHSQPLSPNALLGMYAI